MYPQEVWEALHSIPGADARLHAKCLVQIRFDQLSR